MEHTEIKQETKETLGVNHLASHLAHIQKEKTRLTLERVNKIFRQIISELPYAQQALPPTLAEALNADAPLKGDNLTLNEVITLLGRALFNPEQKDDLLRLTHTYLHDRKRIEKEYAAALLPSVLKEYDLKFFPENSHPAIKNLLQIILEKIINEKQSRKISGYVSHALIDILDPIIHNRSSNAQLEQLRSTFPLEFRKFITQSAQFCYEKVNNEATLTAIIMEKETAFYDLKDAITTKAPTAPHMEKLINRIWFTQHDKNTKHEILMQKLDTFLKPSKPKSNQGVLSLQLRMQLSEKLRKQIYIADQKIEIYQTDDAAQKIHDGVFQTVAYEAEAFRVLMAAVNKIRENYTKRFLHRFIGNSTLDAIDAMLLDALLGKHVTKRNFQTDATYTVREGGYPHKNILEIYASTSAGLKAVKEKIKGLFAADLCAQIDLAIAEIQRVGQTLSLKPALIEQKIVYTPAPTFPTEPLASIIEEQPAEPSIASKPEPKVTPKPLLMPDTEFELEPKPAPKVAPKPLLGEENEPKFVPKPLIIADIEPESTPTTAPIAEKVETPYDQTTTDTINAGITIMKNYQLGEFEKPVLTAWEKMAVAASSAGADDIQASDLGSENEIHLYVICDLAQQIAAIQEANLADDKKPSLQMLKAQFLEALADPLKPENWDCFEGVKRDQIDMVIISLQ